jgi:hypothetical protein
MNNLIGTTFTTYVSFLGEDITYMVVGNKKYSRINDTPIIDDNKFLCEMVEYGGPLATFTREQILKAVA